MRKWKWGGVKREDRDKRERQKVDGEKGDRRMYCAVCVCVCERDGRQRWVDREGQ